MKLSGSGGILHQMEGLGITVSESQFLNGGESMRKLIINNEIPCPQTQHLGAGRERFGLKTDRSFRAEPEENGVKAEQAWAQAEAESESACRCKSRKKEIALKMSERKVKDFSLEIRSEVTATATGTATLPQCRRKARRAKRAGNSQSPSPLPAWRRTPSRMTRTRN